MRKLTKKEAMYLIFIIWLVAFIAIEILYGISPKKVIEPTALNHSTNYSSSWKINTSSSGNVP